MFKRWGRGKKEEEKTNLHIPLQRKTLKVRKSDSNMSFQKIGKIIYKNMKNFIDLISIYIALLLFVLYIYKQNFHGQSH